MRITAGDYDYDFVTYMDEQVGIEVSTHKMMFNLLGILMEKGVITPDDVVDVVDYKIPMFRIVEKPKEENEDV